MPERKVNPYYLRLLKRLLIQKAGGTTTIPEKMRADLALLLGVGKQTIAMFAGNTRGNFSSEILNKLIMGLAAEFRVGDTLLLNYGDWNNFLMKEGESVPGEDRQRIASFDGWLLDELSIEEQRVVDKLVAIRLSDIIAETRKKQADEEAVKQAGAIKRPDSKIKTGGGPAIQKVKGRGRFFQEQLFEQLRHMIGFFELDFNDPALTEHYGAAERDLFYKLILEIDKWILTANRNPYPNYISIDHLKYSRQPVHDGCILALHYLQVGAMPGRKMPYPLKTLTRELESIGKIRKIVLEIPNHPSIVRHFEQLIDTLADFLLYIYGHLERRFKTSFKGRSSQLVDGIYELLDTEADRLLLHRKLSNKMFLTVTKLEGADKMSCGYQMPASLLNRVLDKLKSVLFYDYGPLELFLLFVTSQFPDAAWKKYGNALNDGFNIPFDTLVELHIDNVTASPILYAEAIIHAEDHNNKLYVRIISEYQGYLLEVNASGNLKELFDKVIDSAQPFINKQFRVNIENHIGT